MAVDGIDRRRRGKREDGEDPVSKHQIQLACGELTQDGTAGGVSRNQILWRERGHGKKKKSLF